MQHDSFTTTRSGLDRASLPMALWEKAKRFGIWNPAEIDFSQDKRDYAAMSDAQRDLFLRAAANFIAGEEAVTLDLLPLIQVIASEGRLEEEMFLTSFLWEEAKHVDFFSRFLGDVAGITSGLEHYCGPTYRTLFYEKLPENLHALKTDASPRAQVRASTTYNMVVEGMLAETGYHVFFSVMDRENILPGFREGIFNLKRDESRHIAYGVHLLSRLLRADPSLVEVFDATMTELFPLGYGVIGEIFAAYGDEVPFGLDPSEFLGYATGQYEKRYARIMRAQQGGGVEDVETILLEV